MLDEFVEHLIKEGYKPKKSSNGDYLASKLKYGDEILTTNQVFETAVDYAKTTGNMEFMSRAMDAKRGTVVNNIMTKFLTKFKDMTRESMEKCSFYKYQNVGLAQDLYTGDKLLFDKNSLMTLRDNPDAFLETIPKDIRGEIVGNSITCKTVYNPSTPKSYYEEEYRGYKLPVFNSYVPPYWITRKDRPDFPEPPKFFFDFLDHFLPNPECRKYWLQWVRQAITHKNNTMLCFITDPGTGKNTATYIKQCLVGHHNFFKPRKTFFTSQFNSELFNKKLVYFDEVTISLHNKEILKEIMNESLSIERKGMDPIMISNYCSFVLANNIKNANRVDMKDRRFSILDATNEKLLNFCSEEDIGEFVNEIGNPESDALMHIGFWIMENVDRETFNSQIPYRGKTYIDISQLSLWDWEKFLVEKITSRLADKYLWSDIKTEYSMIYGNGAKFGGPSSTQMFLSYYVDPNGDSIADTKPKGTDTEIIPTRKYAKISPKIDVDDSAGDSIEEFLK